MEYYIKVSENEKVETAPSHSTPYHFNITAEGKFYQTVRNAGKLLKEYEKIVIIGEGDFALKAIAVADKIKEQYRHVTENIEVCSTDYKDVWIPKSTELGLENLVVTRAVPTTKILLAYDGASGKSANHHYSVVSGNQEIPSRHDPIKDQRHDGEHDLKTPRHRQRRLNDDAKHNKKVDYTRKDCNDTDAWENIQKSRSRSSKGGYQNSKQGHRKYNGEYQNFKIPNGEYKKSNNGCRRPSGFPKNAAKSNEKQSEEDEQRDTTTSDRASKEPYSKDHSTLSHPKDQRNSHKTLDSPAKEPRPPRERATSNKKHPGNQT